nr:hypothetical protein [uncultured Desulfobacter sp.]
MFALENANFLFARHGGQTQPEASRRHPDQGEDNPNCKGVAGNGRV